MDWIEHQFSTSLSTIRLNSHNSNKNLQMNRRVLFLQMVMFVSMLAAVAGSPQDGGEGDELHQRKRRFIIAKKFLGGVGPGGKSKGEDAAPAAIPVVGIIQRPVAVPVPIPMEQPYYPAPAPYQPPAPQYAPQPQYAPPPPQYAPPQQYAPPPQQYAPPPQQYAPPPPQYAPPPMPYQPPTPYQSPAPYQAPMPYQAPSPYTPQAPPAY